MGVHTPFVSSKFRTPQWWGWNSTHIYVWQSWFTWERRAKIEFTFWIIFWSYKNSRFWWQLLIKIRTSWMLNYSKNYSSIYFKPQPRKAQISNFPRFSWFHNEYFPFPDGAQGYKKKWMLPNGINVLILLLNKIISSHTIFLTHKRQMVEVCTKHMI